MKRVAKPLSALLSVLTLVGSRVFADLGKFEPTEGESILIGTGFGTTPSIEQGPDGNLYVVSVTDGAIYKISPR